MLKNKRIYGSDFLDSGRILFATRDQFMTDFSVSVSLLAIYHGKWNSSEETLRIYHD